jgi:hypothetical protein
MGSSSPKNTTSTTTQEPPAYALPHLQRIADESTRLYQGGPNQYYPGQTVTPFSNETNQALDLATQRAIQGSGVNRAAQGYTQDVLGGKYLNSNPYLDATFNQAALATQNQLSSQFASAGRNQNAAYQPRADQLNNLATQIYGGNYAAERGLQNSVLGQANDIANQDYRDIGQLAQVGQQREDLTSRQIADQVSRYDYAQNAPGIALDQYLARINNQPGGSSSATTPYFSNRAASGLGGASVGYGIGSNFGNYGGGIGAVLGGLLGAYG